MAIKKHTSVRFCVVSTQTTKEFYFISHLRVKYSTILTQLGLVRFRHLHQGIILLVEEDLDSLNISIHPCELHQQDQGVTCCTLYTAEITHGHTYTHT